MKSLGIEGGDVNSPPPFAVSKRDAYRLTAYPKLVQRWLFWSRRSAAPEDQWVTIIREGKRGSETLLDFSSLRKAYQRFRDGDAPPLLPSEKKGDA